MKKDENSRLIEKTDAHKDYILKSITDRNGNIKKEFRSLYDSCNRDIYSFVKEIVKSEDEIIKASEAYATASLFIDPDKNHWKRVRAILDDKCQKTYSASYDARIKIGNKSFSVLLRTGGEENIQRYAVMDEGTFNAGMLYTLTYIEGDEINIYDCEIGNDVNETISGRFRVLYCQGIVIFERLS